MKKEPLFVTKSLLPNVDEYIDRIREILASGHLTNHGKNVIELEERLSKEINSNLSCVSNGTLALQIAIKATNLKQEVITTPFSYIATSSALQWQGCTPVFADIDRDTLTLDPESVRRKITSKTTGILATHVYGNACWVEELEEIAEEFGLKLIYDSAHAFNAQYKGNSLLSYGDASITSFHATKLFHTIEGGAVITNNKETYLLVNQLRNFGHVGTNDFEVCGINAKMNEFSAAMGLELLPCLKRAIINRKYITDLYDDALKSNKDLRSISWQKGLIRNYAYYPILFETKEKRENIIQKMNKNSIFPRKYFSPSLNKLKHIFSNKDKCPISEDISERILCLPLSSNMHKDEALRVIKILTYL